MAETLANIFKAILVFAGMSLLMKACTGFSTNHPTISNNPVTAAIQTTVDKVLSLGLQVSEDYIKDQIKSVGAAEAPKNSTTVILNNGASFSPDELAKKHDINLDQSQDLINQRVAQVDNKILQDIGYCTEFGFKAQNYISDTPLMYQKRYECMINKGYNENDEIYISTKYKAGWSYKASHS